MAISSAALNGTNSSAKYQSVYLEFWQVSQSIANNQTTFGYKAYMKSTVSGSYGNTGYGHYTFTGANPIAKVSNQTWSWNYTTSQLIKEGTFTKDHAADGTLANQTLTVTAGGSTALGYATVSVTLPVATIPRATTPTLDYTTRDMGAAILITVNGASTAFTHNLYYAFPGIGTTFITTVAAGTTSYLWTIPTATLAPKIPNATSGTVTITCETLSGSEVIGTKTTTFTATIPTSVIPTIPTKTATEAVSGIAAQFGAFIQGKSKLSLSMAASGVYGSEISSYSITANGQTFSASSGTTGFLNTIGTNTITYNATDSRGRSATATLNVTVLAYTAPQITVFKVERVNGSGVADPTGTAVKATYAITVASLNSKNTKTYTLKYKTSVASTYTSVALTATSYTPNTSTIPAVVFSTSHIYNFELVATDYFGSTTVTGTVNSGFVPAHFRAGGKGIGIGMRATKDALQVGLPTEFNEATKLIGGVESLYTDNLDTAFTSGLYYYTTGTQGRPTDYGVVQTIVGIGATHDNSGNWLFQLAFDAGGGIYHRQKINAGTWSQWSRVFNTSLLDLSTIIRTTGTQSLIGGLSVTGTDTSGSYNTAPIQIREVNNVLSAQSADNYAPYLSFHWGERAAGSIMINSIGELCWRYQDNITVKRIYHEGMSRAQTLYYPTFTTGWTNWGQGYQPVSYYKDAFNIIHLQGMVQSTSTAQYVFTLPTGWRPAYNHTYTVNYNGAQSNLYITSAGVVHHANAATSAGKWLSLDGICFEQGA